jgi:hypothetical protein
MTQPEPLGAALIGALAAVDRAAAAAAVRDEHLAERLERHARDLEVELVHLSRNATNAAPPGSGAVIDHQQEGPPDDVYPQG